MNGKDLEKWLTLFHKLDCQAGTIRTHKGKHAYNHNEHSRAEHWRSHYQQLLNIGQEVLWCNLLQKVLWKNKYSYEQDTMEETMEGLIKNYNSWNIKLCSAMKKKWCERQTSSCWKLSTSLAKQRQVLSTDFLSWKRAVCVSRTLGVRYDLKITTINTRKSNTDKHQKYYKKIKTQH